MRTAFLIPGFLLVHAFACAQTNATNRPPSHFPKTGISCAELEPAFRQFRQMLATNRVSILTMGFDDSDHALITARVKDSSDGGVRDFTFRRVDGKWRASGEAEARPAVYPNVGITAAELEEAISQIKEGYQIGGILWMTFEGAIRIEVTTGRQNGPRAGSGHLIYFEKKDGKWKKTGEGLRAS